MASLERTIALACASFALAGGCRANDTSTSDAPADGGAVCAAGVAPGSIAGPLVIDTRVAWCDATVTANAMITIVSGGELVLENTTLRLSPNVDDRDVFRMEGNAKLTARGSRLESGSGKQWHLDLKGHSEVFLVDTIATGHSGIRAKEDAKITASGARSNVEELQVADNATLDVKDGASAYVVLWFTGTSVASLTNGELSAGQSLTRSFSTPSGAGTTGHVNLANASVIGWQLDLKDTAKVTIDRGENIVLAMHLVDTVQTIPADLTSATPRDGAVDFSGSIPPGPKLTYTASAVTSFNLYTEGASSLDFTGTLDVTEPNVGGASKVTFGPKTSLAANLAQTYDTGEMILNGVKLVEAGSHPSFTADSGSLIRLNDVVASPGTRVASVGSGRVLITVTGTTPDAAGWTKEKFEAIEPDAAGVGGIFVNGARVAP